MFDPALVHEWLVHTTRKYPDKPAVICGDQTMTYRRLDEDSNRLADSLMELGLKPHDRVVIFMDNSIEVVVSFYGILKAGGAFVILNPSMKSDKMAYILANSDASVVIAHISKAKDILDAVSDTQLTPKIIWIHPGMVLPEPVLNAAIGYSWNNLMKESSIEKKRPRLIDQDLAALIYTSGSTGLPKGVISSHRHMITAARSIIRYISNVPDDIILTALPLSFDYGLYQILMSVMFGGTIVLEKSFLYFHDILSKISSLHVTGFPIVPTMLAMLLNMKDPAAYDFSTLRYITNTGAALPVDHIRRFRKLFPDVAIISMFGLTECKRVSYLPPDQIDVRPDSVGMAIPDCQTFILDENNQPVPPGQVGQLVIRGSNVMAGYWKDPELTARYYRPGNPPYQHERWLYSGDYFKQDDQGYLYFLGRMDDMIKTRGERVSPKEIENILLRIDGIHEAAVIGIPDSVLGQVPKAFLVKRTDSALTEKDVLLFASQNMENFMVPRKIQFLSELPKTPNGKVDKKALKHQEYFQ